MQSWILIGIALTIVAVIWISGSGTKKSSQNDTQAKPTITGLTPQDVQRNLEEAERNRAADLQKLNNQGAFAPGQDPNGGYVGGTVMNGSNNGQDEIEKEKRKRDYESLFSSNVAASYRQPAQSSAGGQLTPNSSSDLATTTAPAINTQQQLTPQQIDQNIAAVDKEIAQLQAMPDRMPQTSSAPSTSVLGASSSAQDYVSSAYRDQQPSTDPQPQRDQARRVTTQHNQASGKDLVVFEGTVLESALVNRLNGDFSGPVICMMTNDIYSHDHSRLLIPAGTKILGESKKVDAFGQERLAVVFHRLIMPDGYSVDLDQFPGLNQIGETALKDKVNNHYFKIFGASIAIGSIAGLASIGTSTSSVTGLPTSPSDAYRQGVSASLAQSSMQVLNRFLNILPTVTIREGHRVKIYLMEDLHVPDYQHHEMPPDL